MATTTNYGWTTPDDTALVKDGASAIRTLGSSVDTTTKALNPSTTLGDIEYRSSTANTNTRLGIGSTGDVLTVAGGVPSWAAPAAGGMTLLNAGGTTLTGASVTISSIPATYIDLYILAINFRPVNDNASLAMFINGDSTATKYCRVGSGLYTSNNSFADGNVNLVLEQDNGATSTSAASMTIKGYTQATWKTFLSESITNNATTATNANIRLFFGATNITTAISSLTFLADSGNMTSGTVYVYGVK
jgi:hypothetical protein